MIRHRRSEVALMLPSRLAETRPVRPSTEESELYRLVSARVRDEGRSSGPARALALRTVQQLAGSSPLALAPTLEKLGWADLGEQARAVRTCTKTAALGELLDQHRARQEKVSVFTAFRETLSHLTEVASGEGRRHRCLRARRRRALLDRVGRRRPEPAVLSRNDQFRPAVEPDADRAAPWEDPSDRPDA
jgi:hypothetical protein